MAKPEWREVPTDAPDEYRYLTFGTDIIEIGRVEVFEHRDTETLRAYGHGPSRRLGCFYSIEAAQSAVERLYESDAAGKTTGFAMFAKMLDDENKD